jgi:uncharacterized membrane protein
MIRFASLEPPEELRYDKPGIVRASIGWIRFERLLDAAFEQIRMYSKTDVAVSLRLLRAPYDIGASTPDPEFHRILVKHGMRRRAGCAEKLGEEELRELRARQAGLESFTTARYAGSGQSL